MGQPFEIRDFGCHSILEFLKKFVIPTIEIDIVNTKPDAFTIRSKQIFLQMSKMHYLRPNNQEEEELAHN